MNVTKNVVLNPVDVQPLSFRAALGMDTWLNLNYFSQNGLPVSGDLAAQLQLTGRSTGRTNTYAVVATDITNGRARAFIPASDLDDHNGWRLRLAGTANGEPALLATGTVMPIAFAGIEETPIDVIDDVALSFDYNENVELDVTVWTDAGKGFAYDLTANHASISANVTDGKGGPTLVPFLVTVLAANKVRLSLTATQVNALPASCWWRMRGSSSAGAIVLCEGSVTIRGTVIPALTTTTVTYDYQKPAAGNVNPISGQIIHSNIAQNMLKVAKVTAGLQDLYSKLVLVKVSDEIVVGATVFTVLQSVEQAGWFEFLITPVVQSASSGVTTVIFRRP
jgi:hypothetical protein